MNTSPYRAWEDREQHVTAMLRLLDAPPTSYASALRSVVIERSLSAPIEVTHFANGDEFKRAMREPTHA